MNVVNGENGNVRLLVKINREIMRERVGEKESGREAMPDTSTTFWTQRNNKLSRDQFSA